MAVRVVLRHEHHYGLRRLRRAFSASVGVFVMAAAILASAVGFPVLFVLIAMFGLAAQSQGAARDQAMAAIPSATLLPIAGGSVLIAIVGSVVGLTLVRGNRGLILFLRRFGYAGATAAVTNAARSSLSRTYRLVTLDDAQIAPIGLPIATRTAVVAGGAAIAGGRRIARPVVSGFKVVARLYGLWLGLLIAIPLADVVTAPTAARLGHAKAYGTIIADLIGPHRVAALRLDFHGAFLVVLGILALIVLVGVGLLTLLIGVFVLIGPWSAASGIASGMAKAEQDKRMEISTDDQVEPVVFELAFKSESVFAPKLAVVRVHSWLWRRAVQEFAQVAAAALVDVSDPSQHLLWELRRLREARTATVLVGQYDRVSRLAEPGIDRESSAMGLLARAIDGQTVLAYRTGRAALRTFAGELANALETAASSQLGSRKHHAWLRGYLQSSRFRSRFDRPTNAPGSPRASSSRTAGGAEKRKGPAA